MIKRFLSLIGLIAIAATTSLMIGAAPDSNLDLKVQYIPQDEADKALAIALSAPDVKEVLQDREYSILSIEYYSFGGVVIVPLNSTQSSQIPPSGEIEITLQFTEHFQYRGWEIAQLKVFVDNTTEEVTGLILLDSEVGGLPVSGRAILTEKQEQEALEIALNDVLVSRFLEGKNYTVTRIDGMREWASDFTGKPGVSIEFTFDKEYKFKGDILYPPYHEEETYYLDGTVTGLDLRVNLQLKKVVDMFPHVTSIPRPISYYLVPVSNLLVSLLIGLGIYRWMKKRGYQDEQ